VIVVVVLVVVIVVVAVVVVMQGEIFVQFVQKFYVTSQNTSSVIKTDK